ncbi:MAG: T9SS type A sorting domain-containing protein [Bacteroidales bacterium]|nr:T9SS type A sorting domain-containing protein [Bacteroidales bacterium]
MNCNHSKFKPVLLLLGAMLPLGAAAQTAVTSTGGTAEGGGYALTYSVGQVATAATADGWLREGVVQPITIEEVGLPWSADVSSAVTVYPNPTMDGVVVRADAGGTPALQVRLYTLSGQLLGTMQSSGKEDVRIDLGVYAAGVYMLQVNNKTYKITKL